MCGGLYSLKDLAHYSLSLKYLLFHFHYSRERSGSVVECLTLDPGAEPFQHHCVVSLSKNINPSLVLDLSL